MDQTPGFKNQDEKTILVVDDDPTILRFVSGFLDGRYNVLIAKSGIEAVQRSEEFKGEIHLLLTDFQMAGMSGIELATKLTVQRPQIKVLMMSGFPEGMLVLNEGWHFLAKPFIPSQLQTLINGLIAPTGQMHGAGVEPNNIRKPSYSQYEVRRELFDKRKGRSL
jgi:CheY-like chemotaxis protein